jgi:hypothetical protein
MEPLTKTERRTATDDFLERHEAAKGLLPSLGPLAVEVAVVRESHSEIDPVVVVRLVAGPVLRKARPEELIPFFFELVRSVIAAGDSRAWQFTGKCLEVDRLALACSRTLDRCWLPHSLRWFGPTR